VGELAGQLTGPVPAAAPLQPVGAEGEKPALGLALRQPVSGGPEVTQEEVDALLGIKLAADLVQGLPPRRRG